MSEAAQDVLHSDRAGRLVVQGGAARMAALALGTLATTGASIVLLRYLGLESFGRFVTGMAIVATAQGLGDAGLTVIASRELAKIPPGLGRREMLADLFGLRIVLSPVMLALATGFALVAGYPREIVLGVAIGSAGVGLMTLPLALTALLGVELRNVRVAIQEVIRQVAVALTFVVLALAHARLELFFAAQITSALAMMLAVPALVGPHWAVRPSFRTGRWRQLLAISLPAALSYAISLVYFRVMLIMLSLTADETQTGLFGTSLRVFEMLMSFPALAFLVALPVIAASVKDSERLGYQLQRLTDSALLGGTFVAITIALAAVPVVAILGGSEYDGVPEILRIHVFAFIPVCLGTFAQIALLGLGHQKDLVKINAAGLAFMLIGSAIVIPRWEALGAAWMAIAAETFLAALGMAFLSARARGSRPSLIGAWKVLLAGALGAAAGVIVPAPDLVSAACGAATFALVAHLTGAVPQELFDALPRRTRSDS